MKKYMYLFLFMGLLLSCSEDDDNNNNTNSFDTRRTFVLADSTDISMVYTVNGELNDESLWSETVLNAKADFELDMGLDVTNQIDLGGGFLYGEENGVPMQVPIEIKNDTVYVSVGGIEGFPMYYVRNNTSIEDHFAYYLVHRSDSRSTLFVSGVGSIAEAQAEIDTFLNDIVEGDTLALFARKRIYIAN